jgi:hypothetical protein
MLDSSLADLHRCTVCHDQCIFATAEVYATGRQTYATSRKAMILSTVLRGWLDWTPAVVNLMYSGLSSGIQHAVCVNINDPAGWPDETDFLRAARVEIVRAGKAPHWAQEMHQNWQVYRSPYPEPGEYFTDPAPVLFLFDAVTRALQPEAISGWRQLAEGMGQEMGVLAAGSSGFELYDLGFLPEARQAGQQLHEQLERQKPIQVVSDSPEAVYMLNKIWPFWGLELACPVRHTTEWLAEVLAEREVELSNSGEPQVYLDPSYLGRYLGIIDQPRESLHRLGVQLVEMVRNRQEALPSGSFYGEKPGSWTYKIAQDCCASAQAVGGQGIITASPFDERNLLAAGAGRLHIQPFHQIALTRLGMS